VSSDLGPASGLARLAAAATLAGLSLAPPPGSGPRVGDPCRAVHANPATFVTDGDGRVSAVFRFAGGAAEGRVPLDARGAGLADSHAASVADVRLGSYEAAGRGGAVECRLSGTFHFFCPATGAVDQLCVTWGGAGPRDRAASWPRISAATIFARRS
jgi:hypothetical protein